MSHRRSRCVRLVVFSVCLGALLSLGWGTAEVKASEIRWFSDLQVARQLSVESGRPLLVHFWAPWCSPCKQMEQTTFLDPNVARLLDDHYIPVKLNVDHPTSKRIAAQYGVRGVPADLVIAPDGRILAKSPGRLDSPKYTAMLSQAIAMLQGARMAQSPVQTSQLPAPPVASPVSATQPPRPSFTPGSTQTPNYPLYSGLAPSQTAPLQFAQHQVQPQAAQPQYAVPQVPQQGPYGAMIPSNPPFATQPQLSNSTPTELMTPSASVPSAQPQPLACVAPRPAFQPPFPPQQHITQTPVQQAPASQTASYGLEGYCPVELAASEKWVPGNLQYGAVHEGMTYLFAGPEQQKQFLATPDKYAPVNRGFDIVLSTETGQNIPGKRQHGVFLINGDKNQRQIYLFASEATLKKFQNQMEISNHQASAQPNVPQQQKVAPPQNQLQSTVPAAQQVKQEQAAKPWWYR